MATTTTPDFGRNAPPHNFEAEQALLGAILHSNAAYHRGADFLLPEHFADALHQKIYAAMVKLIERGQEASVFAMKTYLDALRDADSVDGSKYLARLLAASAAIGDVRSLGATIRDTYLRRQLMTVGWQTITQASADDPNESAMEQIETMERTLYELASTGNIEGGFQPFSVALTKAAKTAEAAYKRDGNVSGLATGFAALDHIIAGLHRSDLVILAGRPSMGKTALATNIAFHAARCHRVEEGQTVDGAVVGFFSLEMSAEQLATRIIAEQSGISSNRIRKGEMIASDFDRVLTCSTELESLPLFIDDSPGLSISAIRTRARRLKRMHGLGLIIVDYLQLISSPGKGYADRVNQVGEITRGLKIIAKELDVPVLALSQLSRAVEQRDDKRPQLSDLRESGSIEQDADVVMFVYREEYYLRKAEPRRKADETDKHFSERMNSWNTQNMSAAGRAEIIIDKQRHGPVGKAILRFDATLTRFSDIEAEEQEALI